MALNRITFFCFAQFLFRGNCRESHTLHVPPMGLNTWYAFGTSASFERTTEENVLAVAGYMNSSGLLDLGYKFLVVDDGWSSGIRGAGGLEANASKFPFGMGHVARRVRDLGLTLGLYTTPGKYTCAGESGGGERASGGHESEDVRKWLVEWGIGWIKDCVCNSTLAERRDSYRKVRAEIEAVNSTAALECANYMDSPWQKDPTTGRTSALDCDVYTVSDDVPDNFEAWNTLVDLAEAQGARFVQDAGEDPPIWPSFDYVRVGGVQSRAQYQAQIGFMAITPSPLFIGSALNLSAEDALLSPSVLELYLSRSVLAIHQDSLGARGRRIHHDATGHNGAFMDVYARPLSRSRGPRLALLLLNRSNKKETFSIDILDVVARLNGKFETSLGAVILTDAWNGYEQVLPNLFFTKTVDPTAGVLLELRQNGLADPADPLIF